MIGQNTSGEKKRVAPKAREAVGRGKTAARSALRTAAIVRSFQPTIEADGNRKIRGWTGRRTHVSSWFLQKTGRVRGGTRSVNHVLAIPHPLHSLA
jgi:hypothetical protein